MHIIISVNSVVKRQYKKTDLKYKNYRSAACEQLFFAHYESLVGIFIV